MPQVISVEGHGDYEFPDDMPEPAIAAAIHKQLGTPDADLSALDAYVKSKQPPPQEGIVDRTKRTMSEALSGLKDTWDKASESARFNLLGGVRGLDHGNAPVEAKTTMLGSVLQDVMHPGELPNQEDVAATAKGTLAQQYGSAKLAALEAQKEAMLDSSGGRGNNMGQAQRRRLLTQSQAYLDLEDQIVEAKKALGEISTEQGDISARNPSFAGQVGLNVTQSEVASAPAVLAGLATRNPAITAGMMFAPTAAQTYGDLRLAGVSPERARLAGVIDGAIEVGTEYLPAHELFKPGSPAYKRLVNTLVHEGIGESVATVTQTLNDSLAKVPGDLTAQDFLDGLKSGIAGIPMTIATVVPTTAGHVAVSHVLDRTQPPSTELHLPEPVLPAGELPAPPPAPQLPAPQGSGVMAVDSTGQARELSEAEERANDAARAERQDMGYGPVRAPQGEREELQSAQPAVTASPAVAQLEPDVSDRAVAGSGPESGPEATAAAPVPGSDESPTRPMSMAERREAILRKRESLNQAVDEQTTQDDVEVSRGTKGNTPLWSIDVRGTPRAYFTNETVARQEAAALRNELPKGEGTPPPPYTRSDVHGQPIVVNTGPTEAQKAAGNYKKGQVTWNGLNIRIENPRGSTRAGIDSTGNTWEREQHADYGYISRSRAKDGDAVDIYIGRARHAKKVFVVDQLTPDGRKYNEMKAVVGVPNVGAAKRLYMQHYPAGWKGLGAITEVPLERFKEMVAQGETTKPIAWQPSAEQKLVERAAQHGPRLTHMAGEAGWHEMGGRAITDEDAVKPLVTGRTKWIARAPWFQDVQNAAPLPRNANGKATQAAVDKALKGESLSTPEQRHLSEMIDLIETEHAVPHEEDRPEGLTDEEVAAIEERLRKMEGALGDQSVREHPTAERSPTSKGHFSEDDVRAEAARALKQFKTHPQLTVVPTYEHLPKELRDLQAVHGIKTGDVRAVQWQRGVYIVASKFTNLDEVADTVIHETVVHFGLRALLDAKTHFQILDGVARDQPMATKRKGVDEYGDKFDWNDRTQRRRAAEELIAYWAPQYLNQKSVPQKLRAWLARVFQAIKDFLRSTFNRENDEAFDLPPKYNRAGVESIIDALHKYLRRGSRPNYVEDAAAEPMAEHQPQTFFSALTRAAENSKLTRAPAAQWFATLINTPGVKQEELAWSGVEEWLKSLGRPATRDEVVEFLKANEIQVKDVVKSQNLSGETNEINRMVVELTALGYGPVYPDNNNLFVMNGISNTRTGKVSEYDSTRGLFGDYDSTGNFTAHDIPAPVVELASKLGQAQAKLESLEKGQYQSQDATQYGEYTTLGGENYRELLLTLPEKESAAPMGPAGWAETNNSRSRVGDVNYRSNHWDEPNILAHVRFDERTDQDGKRVLFIQEIQSDWAQSNRRYVEQITKPHGVRELAENVFGRKLVSVMPLEHMDGGVLTAMENDEVRRAVIASLPVEMVHDLGFKKISAKEFLGDTDVLVRNIPIDHLRPVADALTAGMRGIGTRFRAKLLSAYSAGRDAELLPTLKASDLDAREVVGLLTPERLYHLGLPSDTILGDVTSTGAVGDDASAGWPAHSRSTMAARREANRLSADQGAEASTGATRTNAERTTASVADIVNWHAKILRAAGRQPQGKFLAAPFVGNTDSWTSLVLKRMIRWAAENGFDRIAWTTGDMQNDRYHLRDHVQQIAVLPMSKPGVRALTLHFTKGGLISFEVEPDGMIGWIQTDMRNFPAEDLRGKPLSGLLGQEMADKVMATPLDRHSFLAGQDLEIGGAGMRGFYDSILPKTVTKLVKRWGAKVGTTQIPSDLASKAERAQEQYDDGDIDEPQLQAAIDAARDDRGLTVHSVDVTPQMQDEALRGLPMFQRAMPRLVPGSAGHGGYQALADRVINAWNEKVGWLYGPLGRLPEQSAYLKERYLTLGLIDHAEETARKIFDVMKGVSERDRNNAYNYLTQLNFPPDLIEDEKIRTQAMEVKQIFDDQGRELVDRGLLPEESYKEYAGRYLPRLYLKHVLADNWRGDFGTGKTISRQGYLKKREDIPEEVRKVILGEIQDPAFLASFGVSRTMRDLAMIDFLHSISKNEAWVPKYSTVPWNGRNVTPHWLASEAARLRKQADFYQELPVAKRMRELADRMDKVANEAREKMGMEDLAQYKQVPDTARYGAVRGLWVREEIYDDLVGAQHFVQAGALEQFVDKYGGALMRGWKMSKVAWNPPSHFRNFYGNAIMLHLSGVPAHRVFSGEIFARAVRSIANDDKYYQIAKKYGLRKATFANKEIARIRDEWLMLAKQEGSGLAKTKAMFGRVGNAVGDVYQFVESVGKLAKLIDAMEREGKDESDAMLSAHEWLFDYSLVPQWVRFMRNAPLGIPFLTYQYKAAPKLAETVLRRPWKFLPYMALAYGMLELIKSSYDVDGDDLKKLRRALPEWMQHKGGLYILPLKDSHGRWQVVDLGFIVPWGMFADLATQIPQGDAKDALETIGVTNGPVGDVVAAIKTGIDPFTGKEIMDHRDPPAEQFQSLMAYAWGLAAPGFLTSGGPPSKLYDALAGRVDKKTGEPLKTPLQAMSGMFGVNVYPVDPAETRRRNISFMEYEISEIPKRMRSVLNDKNLTEKDRSDVRRVYMDLIKRRRDELQQYEKDSAYPAALEAGKSTSKSDKIGALIEGKPKAEAAQTLRAAGYPQMASLIDALPDRPREPLAQAMRELAGVA